MPCDSSGYPTDRDYLNEAVNLLCKACRLLDEKKIEMPSALKAWWKEHRRHDDDRRRREREQKEREKMKAAALAKLTKEERRALLEQ